MEEVSRMASTVIPWIGPGVGLVLTWMAWRRFRLRGTKFALVSYAVTLGALTMTYMVNRFVVNPEDFSIDDMGRISLIGGLFGVLGPVLLVVALRKMVAEVTPVIEGVGVEHDEYEGNDR